MRLIVAIIQPTKLAIVREQLSGMGVERMTVCDALGYGRQRGQSATYRGIEYKTDLLRKVCLEIAVNEDFLEPVLEVLQKAARRGSHGEIGDGKVFVLPVTDVFDLSSDVSGPEAI